MLHEKRFTESKINGSAIHPPTSVAAAGYTHILVPTSLASRDRSAVMMGLQLAASHHAKLTLLHVRPSTQFRKSLHWLDGIENLHQSMSRPSGKSAAQETLEFVEAARNEVRRYLQQEIPESARAAVTIEIECRWGEVAQEIVRFADERAADLVVLSSALSKGWLPTFSGCVRDVLRMTKKQVALVRPDINKELNGGDLPQAAINLSPA